MLSPQDAVARVVVELIKREWPQQWPGLLQELDTLAAQGETQTELVMFVLLRLVEDVAVLQTLEQSQRRKEIYSALTANMEQIFRFLLGLLEKHYGAYRGSGSEEHCRVCMAVLNTLSSLVEWVNIQHVMANDKYLLRCLTHLLSDTKLQAAAADCMLGVVGWKAGKISERAQLLCLFESDMMSQLFSAAENAEKHKLDSDHYYFLKKMIEILTTLGEQLCTLWTKDTPRNPPNIEIYLNALLSFTRHPSQSVNHYANELWGKFFRHPDISQNSTFVSYQPKWIEVALKKVVKVGYPESDDHPACGYSQLDFDNDEEFYAFFLKYRLCILENVRVIAATQPQLPLVLLDQWLRASLGTASPSVVDLDAISSLLDSTFFKMTSSEAVAGVSGLAVPLLQLLLQHHSTSPTILSELLSCISALFSVVLIAPDALSAILTRIFQPLSAPVTDTTTKEVRTLRRHSCSLLVKLATKFPSTLLPSFSFISTEVSRLNSLGLLSKMEYCTLLEGLIIISNRFGNHDRQAMFLGEILNPVLEQFRGLETSYSDPLTLMEFVGLTSAPVAQDKAAGSGSDQFGVNRSSVMTTVNMVLAVARRAELPTDPAVAQGGGFTVPLAGALVTRNPAGSLLCSVLRHVLVLGHSLNRMLGAEFRHKLHPGFVKAFDIVEVDRNNILGLPGSRTTKNEIVYQVAKIPEPVTKMQNFLTELFENIHHLLSHFCSNIGPEFYHQPGLATNLNMSVLNNLKSIPDFRLRAVNRSFLKSFIVNCPVNCVQAVLLPVLKHFCPFAQAHLEQRWAYIKTVRENPNFDEDNTDSQEVLDDIIIRVMAREYIDIIKAILTSGSKPGSDGAQNENSNSNIENGVSGLSVAGEITLGDAALSTSLVATCLSAITWPDSPASSRACSLLEVMLPRLVEQGSLGHEDAASLMMSVLRAFQDMGHYEANNIALTHLGLSCYELLRPRYPGVKEIFQMVPNCQQEDLDKFDSKIMAGQKGVGEKVSDLDITILSTLLTCIFLNAGKEGHVQEDDRFFNWEGDRQAAQKRDSDKKFTQPTNQS